MRQVFLALALVLFPSLAIAACSGKDLRPTLDAAERRDLAQRLEAVPYPVGNRWRAENDGRVITIVGTMHFDDPRFDAVVARLRSEIAQADVVLVEAGPEEERQLLALISSQPDLIFLTEGPTLIDRLPTQTWSALKAAAELRGIPGFMAAKMQPWYLSLMLALPTCTRDTAVAGKRGLDHRIMSIAHVSGVPVRGIEPFDTIIRVFGGAPIEEQIEMLSLGVATPEQSEDGLATLREDYFEEKHAAAIETTRVLAKRWIDMPGAEVDRLFEDMTADLVDGRNKDWIEVIENTPETRILLAVGAGHLAGENGLLTLLADRGWVLLRERF